MENVYLTIVLAPLVGAIVAGFFGGRIGRVGAHSVTIAGVGLSTLLSLWVLGRFIWAEQAVFDGTVYTWLVSDGMRFEVGFLVDKLTAMMMATVTFVSLMVHIYTIGYMADDEHNWPEGALTGRNSYQRFFSYISLFTFSMLMLVMANNFMQLFFGWEAVGLVSYLLIGFWSTRESAIFANLKAFLVNRVGDFGFLLGIAAVAMYFGTLDYAEVFAAAPGLADTEVALFGGISLMTLICVLLFIGAMGKSAQVPLHVWLPDSMEGPTPISALIHAATMVTAGIFMVARMSPLYELSEAALSFVLIIGATTAFFMGLIGLVQNDIKRVVAYSTLSQLGYMITALGASAYAAGVFHLMTHAFFKALLFLAAGSVIIAMHHKQDIREMGGMRKFMPITWITALIGSLALIGFPGFSGFFSKDAIIAAVNETAIFGGGYASVLLTLGVLVTALYSFRMYFLVFHGKPRMDEHTREHLHETPWVVTVPLVMLAIPSLFIGWFAIEPMLINDWFASGDWSPIMVAPEHDTLAHLREHWHGQSAFVMHALGTPTLMLALGGLVLAALIWWVVAARKPDIDAKLLALGGPLTRLLQNKYGFDDFNQRFLAGGAQLLGQTFWSRGDRALIDDGMVNGSARSVGRMAGVLRLLQTGYLYHYAIAMIVGLVGLMTIFVTL
ncbi:MULTISPECIES: NADH-quinone oxidoreductase subunit L [Marichromatium]|uniref:NADH dehydrogenase subunit L n=1 Tax=Marichromatium gracile TaxID=1048 RepID=A0A4R4A6V2_MARGR|nr:MULTISPECIES: NADH-quinone oxidoreductase subunit L [Marichromatium]MBO8084866.1 NADH-quinone oxidoreductase subunit L [Marichromatium sp.]MBK1709692.1 NADH-quinone oxidoreductase subunit L [Marichromatium gracile]RNE90995.1 NADH-quinone oxidoreductase subunit L [Marichromatium sp. AB31]RNE93770.1 NADH-quinone oxidoreductase subunit L [Marichromatium sp. AB32]TCW34374.1 NADH dehydrogenase subunit L [Marichromatium gracile]